MQFSNTNDKQEILTKFSKNSLHVQSIEKLPLLFSSVVSVEINQIEQKF